MSITDIELSNLSTTYHELSSAICTSKVAKATYKLPFNLIKDGFNIDMYLLLKERLQNINAVGNSGLTMSCGVGSLNNLEAYQEGASVQINLILNRELCTVTESQAKEYMEYLSQKVAKVYNEIKRSVSSAERKANKKLHQNVSDAILLFRGPYNTILRLVNVDDLHYSKASTLKFKGTWVFIVSSLSGETFTTESVKELKLVLSLFDNDSMQLTDTDHNVTFNTVDIVNNMDNAEFLFKALKLKFVSDKARYTGAEADTMFQALKNTACLF